MARLPVKTEFAIHEAVVLTGFTKSMLDYLARERILCPSGEEAKRGRRREYTYADIVILRALHSICEGSGRIRHLRRALLALRQEIGTLRPGARIDRLLFVQGNELCLRTVGDVGRQLRTGQMTLALVVDMGAVSDFIADSIRARESDGAVVLKPKQAKQAEAIRQQVWAPIRARRHVG